MDTRPDLSRPHLVTGVALSAAAILAVLTLVLFPDGPLPRPTPQTSFLIALTSPALTAGAVLLTAALGVLSGGLALAGRVPRALLAAVAALHVLVIGVGTASMSTLMVAGYLTALAVPVAVVILIVQGLRRRGPGRIVAAIAGLALVAGLALHGGVILTLAGDLGPKMLAGIPDMVLALLPVLVGASWAVTLSLVARGTEAARRATTWVTDHRVPLTVLAAAGPLPYAAARATWLTPWPMFAPDGVELAADMRLWGILLGAGGLLGSLLTLLLITPWAQVFPRWMPGVAGRPVPLAAAVVPGGFVASLLCFAAVPTLHGAAMMDPALVLEFALIFPLWLWGPSLALAVWGFAGERLGAGSTYREARARITLPSAPGQDRMGA